MQEAALRRLNVTAAHLRPSVSESAGRHDYKYRGETFKWNGWGFSDSEFCLNDKGEVQLVGDRYLFSGREVRVAGWLGPGEKSVGS